MKYLFSMLCHSFIARVNFDWTSDIHTYVPVNDQSNSSRNFMSGARIILIPSRLSCSNDRSDPILGLI